MSDHPPAADSTLAPSEDGVAFAGLLENNVVLDLTSPFVVIGKLIGRDHRYLILEEADVHDLRDTSTTREEYVLNAHRHGLNANRRRVLISHEQVVAIAALTDVAMG